jgi:hypothetical protein
MINFDPHSSIEPWHVLTAMFAGLGMMIGILWRALKNFKSSVVDELRVTRISIKELLADLAERNPQAMARIIAAMDDQSVVSFVRSKKKTA